MTENKMASRSVKDVRKFMKVNDEFVVAKRDGTFLFACEEIGEASIWIIENNLDHLLGTQGIGSGQVAVYHVGNLELKEVPMRMKKTLQEVVEMIPLWTPYQRLRDLLD